MSNIRRLSALLLVLALLLAVTACGAETGSDPETVSVESAPDTVSASAEEAAEPASDTQEPEAPGADEMTEEPEEPEASGEEEAEPFVYDLPLTEEPASFTLFSMAGPPFLTPFLGEEQSYNTAKSTKYLAELTGVKIDYREVDMFSFAEQFSLMVASGDYTDMMTSVDVYYTGGSSKAYADDIIIDLTKYVENDMPVLKAAIQEKGLEKELMNDDGQYLVIQSINSDLLIDRGGIIRKDYLDQLGLEIPETYDQLFEAGKAIKNEFGLDYVFYLDSKLNPGVSFSDGFDLPGFDMTNSGSTFYQVDGQVRSCYVSDDMKAFMSMLAQWYQAGLISPDFFNHTQTETRDIFEGGQCAVCWDNADSITNYNANALLQETGFDAAAFPHMKREAGQTLHFTPSIQSWLSTDGICLSRNCENVDLAIRFLDFMFSEPGQLLCNYGLEGESYALDENGQPQWTEAMYPTPEQTFLQSSATYLLNSIPSLKDIHANDSMTYDQEALEATELWKTGFDGAYDYPSNLTLTTEETEEYAALITDIDTYASEYLMRWLTGGASIDETWDSYVEELDRMGLETCIEIQQAALDRYYAR